MTLAADLAATHKAAFTVDRAWSEPEIAALLSEPSVVLCGDASAFVLGRVTLDEAEILTVATHPHARRMGLARGCLTGFHAQARRMGAARAFIEVADDNAAACALYFGLGYEQVGRRKAYYQRPGGRSADALVLARALDE